MVRGGDPSAAGNQIDLLLLQLSSPPVAPIFSATTRSQFALDRFGRVVFVAVDNDNQDAIYRSDGQQLDVIMQTGQDAPFGSNVNIASVATTFLANDEGQLAFMATSQGQFFQVLNTDSTNLALLQSGQMLDDGRSLGAFRNSALNNNGQMLLRLNTSNDTFGYYIADDQGTNKIFHVGEPAPDGLGSFTANVATTPNLNDSGQAVLQAFVDDVTNDYAGLFFHDGALLTELIRTGDPILGGDRLSPIYAPRINNNGSIAYQMVSGGAFSMARLVLRRGGTETVVVSEGDMLPAPIGLPVETLRGMVLNEQDQVLFRARLRDGGTAVEALLMFDPDHGLALVARHFQAFQGDVMAAFTAAMPFGAETNANWKNAENSFNNQGQVAFTYLLNNGEAGVALAEVTFDLPDDLFSDGFESLSIP